MRHIISGLAICALGACGSMHAGPAVEAFEGMSATINSPGPRAFAVSTDGSTGRPGPLYIVAEEHGELHTYSLRPCRGGTHICGGSGRVGHLEQTEDFDIVRGAYPHRVFYLSPGGDGVLIWRGVERDLAWD